MGIRPSVDDSAPAPHVLREYALLADGERGALVGPDGHITWLCAPRRDSGSVFWSLLGAAGHDTVTPAGRAVWGGAYEESSLVWRHQWSTTAFVHALLLECAATLPPLEAPGAQT